ncbi:hypothetical protein T08_10442 [Trichinella sp. T8]|nr:hypothetical protein T08_8041 [Trichinella sp. T8]KRZ84481.1 hypothetical protein T08_10442 [Trichinella sp. T8]
MTKMLKVGKTVPVTLHQVVADSHLVTIYSATIYGIQFSNLGGVPQVDNNLLCKIFQLNPK